MSDVGDMALREAVARAILNHDEPGLGWPDWATETRADALAQASAVLAAIAATVDPDALRDAAATLQHRWQSDPACEGDDPVAVFLRNLSEVLRP